MNVSCFQDINILLTLQSSVTLMTVVGERRLTYYNFIILLLCSQYIFLNNINFRIMFCLDLLSGLYA